MTKQVLRGGTAYKRLFWRINHRLGPGWSTMPASEIRKYLRQVSWRRAK